MKYAQKKDGWCGPASLSYALGKQGVRVSQEKLAKLTKTNTSKGVDPKGMISGTKKLGVKVQAVVNKTPTQTLSKLNKAVKKGKSVVVDYISGDRLRTDGHYSVFLGATKDKVKLFDPSNGGRHKSVNKDNFINHWKDITKKGKIFKSWGMIIHK